MADLGDLEALFAPFQSALGPYRERLAVFPSGGGVELVPAVAYLEQRTLLAAVERVRKAYQAPDLRVAASLWNKHYNAAILPGVLSAMTLLGVSLNAAITNVSIVLRDGLPAALHVHNLAETAVYPGRLPCPSLRFGRELQSVMELQRTVFTGLVHGHLALVVDRLHGLARVPREILWGNAGNLCADLYERIAACRSIGEAVAEDRRALLELPTSAATAGPNPLYQSVRYEQPDDSGLTTATRVRRTCCLRYRLPDSNPCYVCPLLTKSERIGLLKQCVVA
ncbi:MAG TPA: siderophore-iron reductase FhuF [Nitrolancea sp.]|nr:siderophore-iron reductase FhuF [Nitrolancea sp.]